jgi:hypothetical protein
MRSNNRNTPSTPPTSKPAGSRLGVGVSVGSGSVGVWEVVRGVGVSVSV